jgi:hypothetical protein
MKHKSETFEKFNEIQSEVENQCGKKIKALWYDRGGECLSHKFSSHPRAMVYPRAMHSNFVGHGSINYELVGPTIIILGLSSRSP